MIDAFEGFFSAAAQSGADVAKAAKFTLDNVNWQATLNLPASSCDPVVDAHLESACANSGPQGSNSHAIAQTLLTVSDQLRWRKSSKSHDDGPDIAVLSRNFAVVSLIGPGEPLQSDKVYAGFSLQAPDIYYPPHAHFAEESYWIIGGNADWRVGTKPWFAVDPGDSIYHESEARHVMQTNEQPLLTIWLWTSHLDSEVMIIRG
ncbi:MAG: hypothetical protein IIA07_13555 [Proteobacteria bacterium]|nr:hypothetical protein [Pseudomonadota bacterium]